MINALGACKYPDTGIRNSSEVDAIPCTSAPRPGLRTPILSQTVEALHLKPNAPYPTQQMTLAEMQAKFREDIRRFQRSQEHVVLKEVK